MILGLKKNIKINTSSELSLSDYPPADPSNIEIFPQNQKMSINWIDPQDTSFSIWKGTKVVYKEGSPPISPEDGILAIDNQVRNQFKDKELIIDNLKNDTIYYVRLFPYTSNKIFNTNSNNIKKCYIHQYQIMSLIIDQNNKNSETCCQYADDAIHLQPQSKWWDVFFGFYPCLFLNGKEVVRLNPNNFSQDEKGAAVEIVTGAGGDVMICFPRLGINIEQQTNNQIKISITNNPNQVNFSYNAHRRNTVQKDRFYYGAFEGSVKSSRLRSLANQTPGKITLSTARTYSHNLGAGYDNIGFYQTIFLQVLYLFRYKNLNSTDTIGTGRIDYNYHGTSPTSTGRTLTKGLFWGDLSGNAPDKVFGIEDLLGNRAEWIEGLIIKKNDKHIYTATTNFNNTAQNYQNIGYIDETNSAATSIGGYMTAIRGNNQAGFLIAKSGGKHTLYYSCYNSLSNSDKYDYVGTYGNSSASSESSIFHYSVGRDSSSDYTCARLMFL